MTNHGQPQGLIADSRELASLIALIARSERIALDTEADSLHCYREKLCLMQISVPEGDFLVDPLGGNDLAALARALEGKEIVLHGADYDLRLLRRALAFQPEHVFDTAIAARFVGHREFSYAFLVEKYFGVTLTKGSQKANWAMRPLSPQMEKYARNDTHYLLPLAERFERELKERDRFDWFCQACERAIAAAATEREREPEESWRIRGAGLLHGREAAVLRALWHWRDEEARCADRPAFHVLRNEQLLEVAHAAARGGNVPAFRHFSTRRGRAFRQALDAALALPPEAWPEKRTGRGLRPTAEMITKADAIRGKRNAAAERLGIEAAVIASRSAIDAIATGAKSADEVLAPWQREVIGL